MWDGAGESRLFGSAKSACRLRVPLAGAFIVKENLPDFGGWGNCKIEGRKKRQDKPAFFACCLKLASNYLAEASPDAAAAAEAEADAFLAFLTFFGLADASADAAAGAEAAADAGAAAAAEAEAIAEAAKAEVANIEAIMTAINFFILVPRLVKKMVIRFESMCNNDGKQWRLTAFRKKFKIF